VLAAVLIPLFVSGEEVHVLFTKRKDDLPNHGGQVSFPGGTHEPGVDDSLRATALREAHEEIGLAPRHVNVLGALDDIRTFATNFVIAPYVGMIPHPYTFNRNAGEVAEIFSVPMRALMQPENSRSEVWEFERTPVTIRTIRYRDKVIWGATERISRNLLTLMQEIGQRPGP